MADEADGGGAPDKAAKVLGKESLRPPLPKRFYKEVAIEAVPDAAGEAQGAPPAFRVLLDGRPIKTPKKRPLALPKDALAQAVAAEWRAQGTHVDPAQLPLTRIANTAIDAVADAMAEVAADIVAFSGSDLLCYRAEGPSELQRRQALLWDPVLGWAREALGAHFAVTEGVRHVVQPEAALERVAAAIGGAGGFELSAVHVMTTLTGSALLAIAHARGAVAADEVWQAAHVDEDYQIELWGRDAEAEARRAHRRAEFDAASRMLALLR